MLNIKWSALTAVASGTAVVILSMFKVLDSKHEEFAKNASFIDNAVRILKSQSEVVKMFGTGLEIGKPSFHDGWSRISYLKVQLRVPVWGSEDKGAMYTYAKKLCKESALRLYKVEVTFDKIQNKRLVLLDLSDEQLKKLDEADRQPEERVTRKQNEVNKSDYHRLRAQQALEARQAAAAISSENETK